MLTTTEPRPFAPRIEPELSVPAPRPAPVDVPLPSLLPSRVTVSVGHVAATITGAVALTLAVLAVLLP